MKHLSKNLFSMNLSCSFVAIETGQHVKVSISHSFSFAFVESVLKFIQYV